MSTKLNKCKTCLHSVTATITNIEDMYDFLSHFERRNDVRSIKTLKRDGKVKFYFCEMMPDNPSTARYVIFRDACCLYERRKDEKRN